MHSPPCFPGEWFNSFAHEEVETRRAMTAEQQLERSVLEGKERDELHAIAQALSVKTNTRTKKADMIDGILKATGVSVDDNTSPNPNVSGVDGGPASNGAASPTGSAARSRWGTRPAACPEG